MVDLMSLLSDALIGSFQMFMLNDFGKNMFPYRIKTCWKRILIYGVNSVMKPGGILLVIETVEDVPDILITQSFMMTAPKDRRKATNTMFLNRKQWLEILEENGFCNSEEFPGYGEYLEVLGQKLFYCTKE